MTIKYDEDQFLHGGKVVGSRPGRWGERRDPGQASMLTSEDHKPMRLGVGCLSERKEGT